MGKYQHAKLPFGFSSNTLWIPLCLALGSLSFTFGVPFGFPVASIWFSFGFPVLSLFFFGFLWVFSLAKHIYMDVYIYIYIWLSKGSPELGHVPSP